MAQRRNIPLLPQKLDTFNERHPVAHAIRTGDNWCYAWLAQKSTPLAVLTRKTGMSAARLHAIMHGDRISRAELDALSVVWGVSSNDLMASMPDPSIVVQFDENWLIRNEVNEIMADFPDSDPALLADQLERGLSSYVQGEEFGRAVVTELRSRAAFNIAQPKLL